MARDRVGPSAPPVTPFGAKLQRKAPGISGHRQGPEARRLREDRLAREDNVERSISVSPVVYGLAARDRAVNLNVGLAGILVTRFETVMSTSLWFGGKRTLGLTSNPGSISGPTVSTTDTVEAHWLSLESSSLAVNVTSVGPRGKKLGAFEVIATVGSQVSCAEAPLRNACTAESLAGGSPGRTALDLGALRTENRRSRGVDDRDESRIRSLARSVADVQSDDGRRLGKRARRLR